MEDRTEAGTRCGQCSAAVRAGAPWCTQCYAPAGAAEVSPEVSPVVSPVARPVAEARPASVAAVRAAEPVVPAVATATGTWPCSACSQANDLADPACGGCGTPFLAAVRDDRPTVVLPGVGDLLALSPVRRVGLAVGTVLAFLLITSALALLLA